MKNFLKSEGFTLIELMIVIGVISILIAGVIAVLNPAEQIQKANDSRRKSDLLQIQKSLEQYYEDNGRYPPASNDYKIIESSNDQNGTEWGNPWTPYMSLIPKDPAYPDKTYAYYSDNITGQFYFLYASLDRGSKDKAACNGGNPCKSMSAQSPQIPDTVCGSTCNYGVSSPNFSP